LQTSNRRPQEVAACGNGPDPFLRDDVLRTLCKYPVLRHPISPLAPTHPHTIITGGPYVNRSKSKPVSTHPLSPDSGSKTTYSHRANNSHHPCCPDPTPQTSAAISWPPIVRCRRCCWLLPPVCIPLDKPGGIATLSRDLARRRLIGAVLKALGSRLGALERWR
jgi:hypothetical protein